MSKEPLVYINHIADECNFILSTTNNLAEKDLLNDEILKRAIARSLDIIGEATRKVPADFKARWHTVEWKNMAGMRDRLIHDYLGVNYSIVWDVVVSKIPVLYNQVLQILEAEKGEGDQSV